MVATCVWHHCFLWCCWRTNSSDFDGPFWQFQISIVPDFATHIFLNILLSYQQLKFCSSGNCLNSALHEKLVKFQLKSIHRTQADIAWEVWLSSHSLLITAWRTRTERDAIGNEERANLMNGIYLFKWRKDTAARLEHASLQFVRLLQNLKRERVRAKCNVKSRMLWGYIGSGPEMPVLREGVGSSCEYCFGSENSLSCNLPCCFCTSFETLFDLQGKRASGAFEQVAQHWQQWVCLLQWICQRLYLIICAELAGLQRLLLHSLRLSAADGQPVPADSARQLEIYHNPCHIN